MERNIRHDRPRVARPAQGAICSDRPAGVARSAGIRRARTARCV